jgi:hypothetical protein
LRGYKGNVKKSAAVFCKDPKNPCSTIVMTGKVQTLITVVPKSVIQFKGFADQLGEQSVELIADVGQFHITGVMSNLDGKISYRIEPVEEGRRYRLTVSNSVRRGEYSGFVQILTDMPKKSAVVIGVSGKIEG